MCIIIFDKRENTDQVDKDVFKRSQELNPHGMGIMWSSGEELKIWHTLKDLAGLWKRYTAARSLGLRVAVHFRKGTAGSDNSFDNVHPFVIRPNFAFMHNGTISDISNLLPKDKSFSDTRYINKHLFQTFPIGFLQSPIHRIAIQELIHGDRMFFMDGLGKFTIINEASMGATWEDGVWYSKGYEKLKYYLHGQKSWTTHGSGWNGGKKSSGSNHSTGYNAYGYPYSTSGGSLMTNQERADWWNMSFEERDDLKLAESIARTTPLKLTKKEKKANRKANKAAEKAAKSASKILDIRGNPMKKWTGTDPTPSFSANLFFDYGLLHRFGYFDTRLESVGQGLLEGHQLWAIGDSGQEQPSPIPTAGSTIIGTLYKITHNHQSVIEALDDRHACQMGDPGSSVYYRRYLKVNLRKTGEVYAWVYRYNMPLEQANTAAVVPFGDWTQFATPTYPIPQSEVGTLVLRKVDLRRKYSCPLCYSKKTKTMLMWEDRSDYTLICDDCECTSIILESEPRQ